MSEPTDYAAFLERRRQAERYGFDPVYLPDHLFDFQRDLVDWSVRQGAAAIFADCGLGKTPIQLAWAENVARHTNGRVLVVAPLAVSQQTVREAEKFGVAVTRVRDGKPAPGVQVTNYERLHLFDPADYVGAVCDESGILKSFTGVYRRQVIEFMRKLRYRLLCTATPAPNDYVELGNSSEALGVLGATDMLSRFFVNDMGHANAKGNRVAGKTSAWRFKGHAEGPFWRWVTSWARAVRKPSDLGYPDGRFVLPPLVEAEHVVPSGVPAGHLFAVAAVGLQAQRDERRRTIEDRCARVAALVDHDSPALVWAHLNAEADLLERSIPGAVQVKGSMSDDAKEEALLGFADGAFRVLVTKPTIGAWGLNYQHCAHTTFFPSHSFEQFYQAVRRCWRFGQERPVRVEVVTSESERGVLDNLRRKSEAAEYMFARLVELMNQGRGLATAGYGDAREEVPSWLSSTR